jgi:hypothetical protein
VFFELRGGTRVLIRPIAPEDKACLADGLRRLSAETIRRRFLAAKPRFSSSELRYLTEVDGVNHIALVAMDADAPGQLIGVARCVRLPDRPDFAATILADNEPARRLMRTFERRLHESHISAGLRDVVVELAAA